MRRGGRPSTASCRTVIRRKPQERVRCTSSTSTPQEISHKKAQKAQKPFCEFCASLWPLSLTSNRTLLACRLDFVVMQTEHAAQDLVGVLAEQRRTPDVCGRVGQLDRITNRQIFSALRMIHFNNSARVAQRRLYGDFFHRKNRAARHIER